MIYGASLGPFVKKALIDKGFQTNVSKIIETLSIDPAISNMDAVILGPKDMRGSAGQLLNTAVQKKHASIEILYFYQKDKEEDLIDGDVKKVRVDRVNLEGIHAAIEENVELHAIGRDSRIIESGDNRAYAREAAASVIEYPFVEQPADSYEPEIEEEQEELELPRPQTKTIEQRVMEMGQFADFDYFRKVLEKDTIMSELLTENTQYAGLVSILEALDSKIISVFKDTSITAESRFDQLKQIGVDRSAYKGLEGSVVADKLSAIMGAIVTSAESTVEARIHNIREALGSISTAQLVYQDRERIQSLVETRLNIQMDLMELSKDIIEVYQAMDRSVSDLTVSLDEKQPTGNEYINELMAPVKGLFIPQNMAAITNRLIDDLQKNRVALSIIEDKIKGLVSLVFKLCEEDATIIEYQQKLINILLAQRVEDVVIVDNLIKNSLRLFVGPVDTGRTATALTWSGVLSRRQNTLLLDLTGNSKLRQYGVESISLEQFLSDRMERQLLCVEGDLGDDLGRVDEVVSELKMRLNYYAHIHVLLDSTQTALLNRLARSALSVHFITDCTPRGTKLVEQAVAAFEGDNIAMKAILIDPPVDPFRVLADLSIDPLMAKIIIIPRIQHIRACSLNRTSPYDSREVVEIFEEAFR